MQLWEVEPEIEEAGCGTVWGPNQTTRKRSAEVSRGAETRGYTGDCLMMVLACPKEEGQFWGVGWGRGNKDTEAKDNRQKSDRGSIRTVPRERKTELLEALFARRVMRLGLESGGRWADTSTLEEDREGKQGGLGQHQASQLLRYDRPHIHRLEYISRFYVPFLLFVTRQGSDVRFLKVLLFLPSHQDKNECPRPC